jgi:hypothetical protein
MKRLRRQSLQTGDGLDNFGMGASQFLLFEQMPCPVNRLIEGRAVDIVTPGELPDRSILFIPVQSNSGFPSRENPALIIQVNDSQFQLIR